MVDSLIRFKSCEARNRIDEEGQPVRNFILHHTVYMSSQELHGKCIDDVVDLCDQLVTDLQPLRSRYALGCATSSGKQRGGTVAVRSSMELTSFASVRSTQR